MELVVLDKPKLNWGLSEKLVSCKKVRSQEREFKFMSIYTVLISAEQILI